MTCRLALLLSTVLLSGCVAVWGSAYHDESADSLGGAIRYDHVVITRRQVLMHANDMCSRYGTSASVVDERFGVVLPGGSIDELTYACG